MSALAVGAAVALALLTLALYLHLVVSEHLNHDGWDTTDWTDHPGDHNEGWEHR